MLGAWNVRIQFPELVATTVYADGVARHFYGPKDMLKYLLDSSKYELQRHQVRIIKAIIVTEFYGLRMVDARQAFYVISSDVLVPMGHELIPLASREAILELRLYLSSPLYGKLTDVANTVWLGALPQNEILEQVKSALCVFYPQTQFIETFGLIYAEANASGTPVLAHDIGTASEELCNSNPVIDCTDPDLIIHTLRWRASHGRGVAGIPSFQRHR